MYIKVVYKNIVLIGKGISTWCHRMTDPKIEMHYTPPSSDTIQTKPFPIRGKIF